MSYTIARLDGKNQPLNIFKGGNRVSLKESKSGERSVISWHTYTDNSEKPVHMTIGMCDGVKFFMFHTHAIHGVDPEVSIYAASKTQADMILVKMKICEDYKDLRYKLTVYKGTGALEWVPAAFFFKAASNGKVNWSVYGVNVRIATTDDNIYYSVQPALATSDKGACVPVKAGLRHALGNWGVQVHLITHFGSMRESVVESTTESNTEFQCLPTINNIKPVKVTQGEWDTDAYCRLVRQLERSSDVVDDTLIVVEVCGSVKGAKPLAFIKPLVADIKPAFINFTPDETLTVEGYEVIPAEDDVNKEHYAVVGGIIDIREFPAYIDFISEAKDRRIPYIYTFDGKVLTRLDEKELYDSLGRLDSILSRRR